MQLCVALDNSTYEENIALAKQLRKFDIWLKVGFRTYIRDGKEFIIELKKINPKFKIFLDLKLYDIPNTMADASDEIAKLGIDMFNVHASSGKKAMSEVMKRLNNHKTRPIVIAVTALTSFTNESFTNIYNQDLSSKTIQFAKDAYQSGMDGVVCSAFESIDIKNNTSKEFITLTPGIRPFGEKSDDQQRVANLDIAQDKLVDFIVVGRPIYKSDNPVSVVEKILQIIK